jgi:hypothetical protein
MPNGVEDDLRRPVWHWYIEGLLENRPEIFSSANQKIGVSFLSGSALRSVGSALRCAARLCAAANRVACFLLA